jgi:Uma2 family endonuclease
MATMRSPPIPQSPPQTGARASASAPLPEDAPGVTLYRLSVDQYTEMVRSGIIGPDDRVELLEGLLVEKMTKNPPHVMSGKLTGIALGRVIPPTVHLSIQDPFAAVGSVPEPDVAVVRGSPRDYPSGHPSAADMALVVEVADSSVAIDRGIKRRVYARAGVPVYWILVLPERIVEVYTDPSGPTAEPAYGTVRRFADGESVPVIIDGREVGTVAVADLLP